MLTNRPGMVTVVPAVPEAQRRVRFAGKSDFEITFMGHNRDDPVAEVGVVGDVTQLSGGIDIVDDTGRQFGKPFGSIFNNDKILFRPYRRNQYNLAVFDRIYSGKKYRLFIRAENGQPEPDAQFCIAGTADKA